MQTQLQVQVSLSLALSCEDTHLADIARPCRLLLSGGSHQNDGVGLAVFGLHHHFKVQVVCVLSAPLPFCCEAQINEYSLYYNGDNSTQ